MSEPGPHPWSPMCICWKCGPPWRDEWPEPPADSIHSLFWRSYMALCPTCGNKRCPAAADHDNACTGSNEPGQPGSRYPAFDPDAPRPSIEELEAKILGSQP